MTPLIDLRRVSKRYWLRKNRSGELKVRFLAMLHEDKREVRHELWALRNVSFTVGRGESVGLIGRNGSGKSTLLKLVAGIHRPTRGQVLVGRGIQIGTLIELGLGFHMELSGRENVRLNAAIHGMTAAQIAEIYPAVVEYSALRDFMDVPLKNYSSGMQMRLAFSVAANLDPDVLLLDEIFAVGDEEFQKKCRRTIDQFLADGTTILFVSHSASAVRDVCQRVCLLEHGRLRYDGPVDEGLHAYQSLMLTPPTPALDIDEPPEPEPEAPSEALASPLLDFLRSQGLAQEDYVLAIGGTDRAVRAFVEAGHYFWRDAGPTVDAGLPPIDVATAPPLLDDVPPELWGPVLLSVVRALSPRGRLFVAPPSSRPIPVVEHIAGVVGARVESIEGPDGAPMLVMTRVR
jgi:ABC-type polysaccharide/polyol phosphate transport system ATPase subunit